MQLRRRVASRVVRLCAVGFAVVVIAPLVTASAASRAAAAPVALYPNLKTLPALDLRFDRADITPDLTGIYHNVLRFSNITENVGAGPLIVNSAINPTTLTGPAIQRIMNSDGTYTDVNLNNDIYWHEAHHHYHFDHWGAYELWTQSAYNAWIASGRTVGAPSYSGAKTTSCITDEEFIQNLPNTPYPGPYGLSGCNTDAQGNIHMGLSPGWGDTYPYSRQDQWIDLNQDTLADGTYVLRAVADPNNLIYESANKADASRESAQDNEMATTFVIKGGVIQDSTPPTATVSINNVNTVTNTPNVVVSVDGRDDVSGVDQMRLSNDNAHWASFAYTSGVSVPTSVPWNLSDPTTGGTTSNGIKTVYAQVHDRSGKWSSTYTDTIDLESNGQTQPPPTAYSKLVTSDNPSAYWRLNEASGATAFDMVGNHAGLYTGGVTQGVAGLTADGDKAARLSGTNQYVSVPSGTGLAPSGAISIEAWIRPNALPATGAFSSIATKAESYSLQFNGPRLEFTIMQNGVRQRLQAPAGAIAAGNTYQVVGTYDGTTQRLYVNGAQVASAALSGPITVNPNNLMLGSWDGHVEFFNGTLDEVAVYGNALSPTQVSNHYKTGTTNAAPSTWTLTVTKNGAGSGTVTSAPGGINCGATCAATFNNGANIVMTAAPAAGSTFSGWSGGTCSGTGTCSVALTAATTITASFSSTGTPPPAYATVVQADAPAGYWRLGDPPGIVAADATGAHPGLYGGSPTLGVAGLLTGDPNTAVSFTGSPQRAVVPSATSLSPTSAVSVEAWIKVNAKPAAGSFASIVTKAESYSLQFNGPALEFTIMQNGARRRLQSSASAISTGAIYHVVGTYDGTTQRLYVNGAQVASSALGGTITANANNLDIASWDGASQFLNGTIDEVAVYGNALSAARVAAHYNAGIAKTSAASSAVSALGGLLAAGATPVGGTAPVAAAYDSALGQLYVSRNTSNGGPANGVTVIDARTHAVLAQITTGRWAPGGVAVDPRTHAVYVTSASYGDNAVASGIAVIDGTTRTLSRVIAVGPGPKAVAVNPVTQRLYVTDQGGFDSGEQVAVIDAATGTTLAAVPIGPFDPFYDNPFGLAVDAATNTVYASNPLDGTLYAIDGQTNTIAHTTPLGGLPAAVAVNETSHTVYVADGNRGGEIAAINGRTGVITDTIDAGTGIAGLAVDKGRNALYATTSDGGVLVVDNNTQEPLQTVHSASRLYGVAVDATDGAVAVVDPIGADVRFFTRASGSSAV